MFWKNAQDTPEKRELRDLSQGNNPPMLVPGD
jgi:hypothetical protein